MNLVMGASGQVGTALMAAGQAVGTGHRNVRPRLISLDLSDLVAVRALVLETRPSLCFLPAAWTHVDAAESQPSECRRVNVEAVEVVARTLASLGGRLVFFSTDHVFPACDVPWREDEPTSPVSVYAKTKVEAEAILREVLPERHLILRTSWVFGPDEQGKNFVYRVRDALARGETLRVPADQWGQPTFAPDLARVAWLLGNAGDSGTYHVVGPRWLDRLTWARAIAETLSPPTPKPGDCNPREHTLACASGSHSGGAPRPLRVGLHCGKLLARLGTHPIRDPVAGVLATFSCEQPHAA